MSEKRKDNRGRVLRNGESQRNNGKYQFRYTNNYGQRKYVYADSLEELRGKEDAISLKLLSGIGGPLEECTLAELIDRHIKLRHRLKPTTIKNYNSQLKIVERYPIAAMRVKNVRRSDVISLCETMYTDGLSYKTIYVVKGLIASSLGDAVDDDAIRKNPAKFCLSDYIEDASEPVRALTQAEIDSFLLFLRTSPYYKRRYDMIVLMLETGLRAGELCGLTVPDIDFASGNIKVDKQLYIADGRQRIGSPKSDAGTRDIPMSDAARDALKNMIGNRTRRETEYIIDGHSGFLIVSKNGRPLSNTELWNIVHRMAEAFNRATCSYVRITPHVMRHTFCTKLSNRNVSPKTIQYLMGHNSAEMLKVYDDPQYDVVREEFFRAVKAV